jgi:ABC-type multidrug transport system ATPase subunit
MAFRPADLSTGEQKLVSLARALVLDPELVFLDNPATGLDEDAKDLVYDLLDSLRKAGKSMLLVTGDMGLTHRIADHIVIIRDGRIVAAGTYNDIVACEVPEASGLVARLRARGARTPTPQTVILPPKARPDSGESASGASNEEMDR